MTAPRVLVLGGGVAGITAALDCAAGGASVTLVEVRPRLGGAAYSFEREGLQVDNGQHVFMRCCTAYRALLERLGSTGSVRLQPHLEVPVLAPDGRRAVLRRSALPAPAHMLGALARFPFLRPRQRLRAAIAARALAGVDTRSELADRESLGSWLAAHGQDASAIDALWDLVALPTLNVRAHEASLAVGAFVFQTALLGQADAGDIGFHVEPLGRVIGEPALRVLRESGVEVLLGRRASHIEPRGGAHRVRLAPGGDGAGGLDCDAVVVALPHQRVASLLPAGLEPLAGRLRSLGSSPIVNLHVVFDRTVCELPFLAGLGTPVQYVFDRTHGGGVERGQYLAISLSGAEREMAMSVDELRGEYLPALQELLPESRGARVERFLVTREHAATFRAAPGSGALRPGAQTGLPGLLLAGAYTDTGWPATLEGAVRSGHAAARGALEAVGLASASGVSAAGSASAESAGARITARSGERLTAVGAEAAPGGASSGSRAVLARGDR